MIRPILISLFCSLFFLNLSIYGRNLPEGVKATKEGAKKGMEIIKIDNTRYEVPEGLEVYEKNGVITFQGKNEYMSEKFVDLKEEIKELNKKNQAFRKEAEGLEAKVDKLNDQIIELKERLQNKISSEE